MTLRASRFNVERAEADRLGLQAKLDAKKTQAARNEMGQFATPPSLAFAVAEYVLSILPPRARIQFLDPAFGTGSFFSAILSLAKARTKTARGFEIDPHYGEPASALWSGAPLNLDVADFTRRRPDATYNVTICNPPYVRHHHLSAEEKISLNRQVLRSTGIALSGLTGLYCYFMLLSHDWMSEDGVAAWLVPSEVLDVNYGKQVKRYLAEQVELLRIHRFDPNDVQFQDALVSSAVIVFRKRQPPANHNVRFSYGGSLVQPRNEKTVALRELTGLAKWSNLALNRTSDVLASLRLGDLFHIKRGLATGDNSFFILTPEEIDERGLPWEVFRPVLPSARYFQDLEVRSDKGGNPIVERKLFLLDTALQEKELKRRYPRLWDYLQGGIEPVSKRYLCRTRTPWYAQENRPAPPLLCTYMGRADTRRPFRFILNHSRATATNVYLLLYPNERLRTTLSRNPAVLRLVWQALNNVKVEQLLGEGRVYGGGLHKLEPRELANLDISSFEPLIGADTTVGGPLKLLA